MAGSPQKPTRKGTGQGSPGQKSAGRKSAGQRARNPPAGARARAQRRAEAAARVRAKQAPATADREPSPLDRTDAWVGGGVGIVATIVFLSTFSSHVALGDAPESVAGVRALGIVHAPGYATYVVAARVFGEIVRIGTWELRVNLFSLVCAALTVAGVYFLARYLGAERIGAAVGALVLATALSFWSNAGFAKYYAFSSLLVTVIALCVLRWQRSGRGRLLVVAGVLIGSSIGVSWQLALVMTVGLVLLVALGRTRPPLGVILLTAAAALVTAIAVCVYIIVRARHDPTINFGRATGVSRLWELLTTSDFNGTRGAAGSGLGTVAKDSTSFLVIIARDVGIGAVVLTLVGAYDVFKRRRLDHALFFAVVALGNVVAIGFVAGKTVVTGFYGVLASDGQVSDAIIVLAVLAALGTTRVLFEVERRRANAARPHWRYAVAGVIVLATIAPSLASHYRDADHRIPPISDRYARRVLTALPPNSVFLTGAWEFSGPILNRQVLYHDRPDVTVVSADFIAFPWYREQLVHRLKLDPALLQNTAENAVTRMVTALRQTRPVYADPWATLFGDKLFAYRTQGLMARVVAGTGPQTGTDLDAAAATLRTEETQDGMTNRSYDRFPNTHLYFFYERAHVELAKGYVLENKLDQAANELERALQFGAKGDDKIVNPAITAAREHQPGADQRILAL